MKVNSASRVYQIFGKAKDYKEDQNSLVVWADIFEIACSDETKKMYLVAGSIAKLKDQINSIGTQMKELKYNDVKYDNYIKGLSSITRPGNILSQWKTVQSRLGGESMLYLKMCADILPDEGNLVNYEELDEISIMLDGLEKYIDENILIYSLESLMKKHIDLIRNAISEYKISGTASLNDLFIIGINDFIDQNEVVLENSSDEGISSLKKIWHKFYSAASRVSNVNSVIDNFVKFGEKCGSASEYIDQIP